MAVALYMGMGWLALAPVLSPVQVPPPTAVALMVAGALLDAVSTVIYAGVWPNPLPRIFGFHDVFHHFVTAGSAAYTAAIWSYVPPSPPT